MKKLIAIGLLALALAPGANAGQCYWVCSHGEWVPIQNGVCLMPLRPVSLCPIN